MDRSLLPPREHQAAVDGLRRAEQEHSARLRLLAGRLAEDDAARQATPGNADGAARQAREEVAALKDEQVLARISTRTQRLFSGVRDVGRLRTHTTHVDDLTDAEKAARYGRELVEGGRASVASTTWLATEGAGTNEALLKHGLTGRSRQEMADARTQWRADERTDFDSFLGLGDQGGFGSEVSGDLAFELTILARGTPETDRDHAEIALLRDRHQRQQGTGWLGRRTMADTPERAYLVQQRNALARQLIAQARANAPPDTDIPGDPDQVLGADGRLHPLIAAHAFGPDEKDAARHADSRNGRFTGDRPGLLRTANSVEIATRNYQAEVDRQESIITGAITALAVVVSVALLLIPGVNLVAAGIITALVAGAATMAVKAGMRGDRYGWEEAATDAAQTAIEATLAGAGKALAGGLGTQAGAVTGRLAAVGTRLNSTFGRVGGSVLREGLTGAIGSVAQTAIQDSTWQKGAGKGLEELLKAGGRGAAVGAVAAGVSEELDARLTRSLARGAAPDDFTRMAALSRRLGPKAGAMLREGVGESLGSMAGETAGVLFDVGSGKHKGALDDALAQIGQAGLKDLWAGAARNRVMQRNRARYRSLHAEGVAAGTPSEAQLRTLRLAGISAGEIFPGQGIDDVAAGIRATRNAAALLPPDLRETLSALPDHALVLLRVAQAQQRDLSPAERSRMLDEALREQPQLDRSALETALDAALTRTRGEPPRWTWRGGRGSSCNPSSRC